MEGHEPRGADLARGFYQNVVAPILAASLPDLKYAAARLGSGSDVLGLDDATSRDHDWGCRLTLLVDTHDAAMAEPVGHLLSKQLPDRYQGHPVRFPVTWDSIEDHRVEVRTVSAFATSRLGVDVDPLDPSGGLTVYDWLSLTGQSVLEVTAGPVFANRTDELRPLRDMLRWYPPDVERYVLAAAWQRVGQQLPFLGRTAERGDELGSRLLSAELADDLMWLAFALSRRWPPYRKWRGTVFGSLPLAAELTGPLAAALSAPGWRDREDALATAIEMLLETQRALRLPAPEHGVIQFWDRPYRTLSDEVPKLLLAEITDPEIAALPPGVGCVERWADNVDVLSSPGRRARLRPVYRAWSGDNVT
jgi:Domain of unknown function (DUF4037)